MHYHKTIDAFSILLILEYYVKIMFTNNTKLETRVTQPFESYGVRETRITREQDVDDPTAVKDRRGIYGHVDNGLYRRADEMTPRSDVSGGFLTFPRDVSKGFTDELISIAGLASTEHARNNRYALTVLTGEEVPSMRPYLRKIVVADRLALRDFYRSITQHQYDLMYEQPLDVTELVAAFYEDERAKFDARTAQQSSSGELGFGFAIENHRVGVISAWSRLYSSDK